MCWGFCLVHEEIILKKKKRLLGVTENVLSSSFIVETGWRKNRNIRRGDERRIAKEARLLN